MIHCFDTLLQWHFNNASKVLQIHSLLVTSGYFLLPKPSNTFAFNCLIQAYLRLKKPQNAPLRLFMQMLCSGTRPNHHTFPSLIKSCSLPPYTGFAIHGQSIRRGLVFDNFVGCSLIKLYTRFDLLVNAREVFDEMPYPDLASCNAMLVTLCEFDMDSAIDFFDTMRIRDIISWTTIISRFSKTNFSSESISLFKRLILQNWNNQTSKLKPNEATLVSVLSACANLNGSKGFSIGTEIHAQIIRTETKLSSHLGTALINMYGKHGDLISCENIFQMVIHKQVCTWNAMISALSSNSQETNALNLFDEMTSKNTEPKPNHITFIAVLTACGRTGLVNLGLKLFDSMISKHGLTPLMEHYGCIVDLLGRAGLLKEAMQFIEKMPFRADVTVLGALLSACKLHGNVEIRDYVSQKLINLEMNCGKYMTLRNIYAEEGRWSDAFEIREKMEKYGVKKIAGLSYVTKDYKT